MTGGPADAAGGAGAGAGAGRSSWTWGDSWWLELRALGWMLGATLPITIVLAMLLPGSLAGWGMTSQTWWQAAVNVVLWALMVDAISALPTVVAVLVSLPFTMGLGLLLRPVRSRVLQVIATSALAGTLAALPLALVPDAFVLFVPMSLAAGAAGALARRGEFRRADRLAAAAAAAAANPEDPAAPPAPPAAPPADPV